MVSRKAKVKAATYKTLKTMYDGIDDDIVEKGILFAGTLVQSPKSRKALAWGSIAYSAGRRVWSFAQTRLEQTEQLYRLIVEEDDDAFDFLRELISSAVPETEKRELVLERAWNPVQATSYDDDDYDDDGGAVIGQSDSLRWLEAYVDGTTKKSSGRGGSSSNNVKTFYNGTERVELTVSGHKVSAQFKPAYVNSTSGENGVIQSTGSRLAEIIVECETVEAREAVVCLVNAHFASSAGKRKPALYQANGWGEIQRVKDIPNRELDTVILKPGQIETLVEDIRRFLTEEKLYTDMGQPYHRGILLYGMPGTGKTSIAAAVAHALELDIFLVSLSQVGSEAALKKVLSSVSPRSVLVLEEVDACGAALGDSKESKGLSRDTLLQALDGFTAPHGLITIMTTNHIDRLDPALTRSGRADLKIHIGAVDTDQIKRLCSRFIGYVPENIPNVIESDNIVPADVMEVFKRFLRDKASAGPALVEMLNIRLLENSMTATKE